MPSILALSGSLRIGSSNLAALRAARTFHPALAIYDRLADIPLFNPDIDIEPASEPVARFRRALASADGFVISTPEYAHGIPGAFKNALDWIVSSGEFTGKPVLLINASASGGAFAQAQLVEILTVMGARVLTEATVTAPFLRKNLDADGNLSDADLLQTLKTAMAVLVEACTER
ncbi:MAG TPA: NADPH-dependent FMN reductase [Alphaproteobacteria bacterium]|nr:NADPH-dependent FMN reductase [Alphaproteobacteria bacterium]